MKINVTLSKVKGNQNVDDRLNALKSTERSDDWLIAASSKLCTILQRLKKLTSSNSSQIRQELFKLSDILLRHCQRFVLAITSMLEFGTKTLNYL